MALRCNMHLPLALFLASLGGAVSQIVHPSYAAGWRNSANARSPLGTNLAGIADWAKEYPFINRFKAAQPWIPGDLWNWYIEGTTLDLDADGNVKSLKAGQVANAILFTGLADPSLYGKVFDVFWDGQGKLQLGGCSVLSSGANSATIRLSSSGSEIPVTFKITETNPANYLRNVRVLPQGGICLSKPLAAVAKQSACSPTSSYRSFKDYHGSIVFDPEFLAGIIKYRSLRFMDWGRTNNSPYSQWSSRALISHQFWSTDKGVPVEVMASLANLMSATPWFCVPHQATDAYVTSMATLLKSQLNPSLPAYIEYSNEVWNGGFEQNWYVREQGLAEGLDNYEAGQNPDEYIGMCRWYSRRAQRIFDLFVGQMGTPRLIRVLAGQAAVPFFTETILKETAAAAKCDAFAIAPYFGISVSAASEAAALKALGVDGIFSWLSFGGNADLEYGDLPMVENLMREQAASAAKYGKRLVAYEGGQHFVGVGDFTWDAALNSLMDKVNRDSRMTNVYLSYLASWKKATAGRGVFHHFLNCDGWSEWGRWGAKEYQSQPRTKAPKLQALMQFIDANPLSKQA